MTTISIPDPPPPRPDEPARPERIVAIAGKWRDVLVIVSPDGHLEAYGSPGTRVCIAERLDVPAPAEALEDEYLRLCLPRWAAEIYRADRLRGTHTIRPQTIEEEADRLDDLAILRAVQGGGKPAFNIRIGERRRLDGH